MTKPRILGIFGLVFIALFISISCAAPAAPPPEAPRAPAAVVAVPNVVAPVGNLDYIGANFVPGEKISVTFLYSPDPNTKPIENVVATGANVLVVDKLGSFRITKAIAPDREGIYPIRVYDEKGKLIASSLFQVKAPEVKK